MVNIQKSTVPVHIFLHIAIKSLESLLAILGLFQYLRAWVSVVGLVGFFVVGFFLFDCFVLFSTLTNAFSARAQMAL